jgi:hypothetical protein
MCTDSDLDFDKIKFRSNFLENNSYELELVPVKIVNTCVELWTVKHWKEMFETDID